MWWWPWPWPPCARGVKSRDGREARRSGGRGVSARGLGGEQRRRRCGKGGGRERRRRCADGGTGEEIEAEALRNCIAAAARRGRGREEIASARRLTLVVVSREQQLRKRTGPPRGWTFVAGVCWTGGGGAKRMAMTGVVAWAQAQARPGLFWLVSSPCHYHHRVAHAFATLVSFCNLQLCTVSVCSAHNTRLNVFVTKKELYYATLLHPNL